MSKKLGVVGLEEEIVQPDDLENLATKETTLAGYGITDTYTKSEIDNKVSSVYRSKGSKTSFAEIESISNPTVGDVYNALDTGDNYVWTTDDNHPNGFWDKLSGIIDLSAYDTREQTEKTIDDKLKPYADANAAERTARETADTSLGQRIDQEKSERQQADAALAEAVSHRTSIANMGDGRWRISDITYDTRKQQVLFG